MAPRLTQQQKSLAYRLKKHGLSTTEIAQQLGCGDSLLFYMFQRKISSVGVATVWTPVPGRSPLMNENRSCWAFAPVTR